MWEKGVARAKANGGSNGYNRKDKPKAYLRQSGRITAEQYNHLTALAEEHNVSIYALYKALENQSEKDKCVRDSVMERTEYLERKLIQSETKRAELQRKVSSGFIVDKSQIIGKRNGKLTVIGYGRANNNSVFICRCDCGRITIPNRSLFMSGKLKSCGCLQKEREADIKKQDRLYSVWKRLHRKPEWCNEWQNYDAFYEWAYKNGYCFGDHLHRKNVRSEYSVTNCYWGEKPQYYNITGNHRTGTGKRHECNGEMLTFVEMSEKYGVSVQLIRYRVKTCGMTYSEAVNTPKNTTGRKPNSKTEQTA